MNDIVAKAEELGKAIAASDRFTALAAARKAADTDPALQADIKALENHARRIARLEHESKPIEPDDKHRLRDLQEKVTVHPAMRSLARAEADFAELMNRVYRSIQTKLQA